ncbi:tetratricopeptide repeat protein [bacterium BMS3Bbin09]|nr:tetratricopeptide repeat protein [bacterium BMS3Bbin09]
MLNKYISTLHIFIIILITILMGCTTIEHTTLPASITDSYRFPSYIVRPPQDKAWRYYGRSRELQSLTLLNKDDRSMLFFWIEPVLMEMSNDKREENIVEYFQKKELEKFKLSPDLYLTDKLMNRSQIVINKKSFKVITIEFEMENEQYMFTIYYHVSEKADILYSISILKSLTFNQNKDGWEDAIGADVEKIIANMSFLSPDQKDMQELRVSYAHSDFEESAKDKYLAKNAQKVREKYSIAVREAKQWLAVKPDSYRAYGYLGLLATYNKKFEHYGDGFNAEEVEKHLLKSLEIRPYYKVARMHLAQLYELTDRKDDAIKAYEFAITLSPNDEDLYYKLAQLYEELGERDKAKEYYEKAVRYWSLGFATREDVKIKLKNWDDE